MSRGQAIRARLDDMGITDREFERESGVSRGTLTRAIADDPTVSESKLQGIEAWLDRREARHRGIPAEPHVVTFRLMGNFGVDVVVSGPVENLAELEESVQRLLRGMGQQQQSG